MSPYWPWKTHPATDLREVYVERTGRWLRLQARKLRFIRADWRRYVAARRTPPNPALDHFVRRLWLWTGISLGVLGVGMVVSWLR